MSRLTTFFLSLRALVMATLAAAPAVHAQGLPSADDAAWATAVEADTPEAYQGYLEEFPVGRHAEQAFRLVIEGQLEAPPDAAQAVDVY